MCGIAGIIRWDRRPILEHEIRDDVRRHGPPRTRRRRHLPGRRRCPGHAAAEHHRSGQRPPADLERRRIRLDRVQRRDLQLQAASRSAGIQRPPAADVELIPKRSCTCTRTSARDASSTCGACSRLPSGIPGSARCCSHAIASASSRSTTQRERRAPLRFGAEAAASAMTSPIDRSAGKPSDTCSRSWRPRQTRASSEGVSKLEPARVAIATANHPPRIERYWDVAFEPDESASEDVLVERLRERLHDAVAAHQVSDVPVGAFLSGGIDSSAVVALMAKPAAGRLKTFSIGFAEVGFDELDARACRRHPVRHRSLRPHPPPRRRPDGRRPDVVSRRAVRRHLGNPHLHGVEARVGTREGGPQRRRRRRALRRLRQVRGRSTRAQPRTAATTAQAVCRRDRRSAAARYVWTPFSATPGTRGHAAISRRVIAVPHRRNAAAVPPQALEQLLQHDPSAEGAVRRLATARATGCRQFSIGISIGICRSTS